MRSYLQELTNSLRNNKLRTFLTGFSIAWGIIVLVVMLGAGKGVENGIRGMVSSVGANQVEMVFTLFATNKPYAGYKEGRQLYLTPAQLQYMQDTFADRVDLIAPSFKSFTTATTTYGSIDLEQRTINWQEQGFDKIELRQGRLFTPQEHSEGERVALISDGHVSQLFGEGVDPVGELLTMYGTAFKVVGVIKAPSPFFGVAYIPTNSYVALFPNQLVKLKEFIVYPMAGQAAKVGQLKDDLTAVCQQLTKFDPTDSWAVYVQNSVDQAKTMDLIFISLQALLWIMGVGSLSIGTIGVSNIMHVTVQERMREIGIRKALGAKPKDILQLVMGESLLLSLVAGLVGLLIGIGLVELIDYLTVVNGWGQQEIPVGFDNVMVLTLFSNPQVNMGIAVGALVVLVGVGLIAGYGPAKKAIKIPAVVAMRDMK